MNLHLVRKHPTLWSTTCKACGKRVGQERLVDGTVRTTPVFADLNGEPFEAYYCEECAAHLRGKQ